MLTHISPQANPFHFYLTQVFEILFVIWNFFSKNKLLKLFFSAPSKAFSYVIPIWNVNIHKHHGMKLIEMMRKSNKVIYLLVSKKKYLPFSAYFVREKKISLYMRKLSYPTWHLLQFSIIIFVIISGKSKWGQI